MLGPLPTNLGRRDTRPTHVLPHPSDRKNHLSSRFADYIGDHSIG
jgi:hypothetical protein